MPRDNPLLGLSQRLPPSNLQAEQALLGAILANNRAYERVADYLLPEHFADPVHGRIYQVIADRILDGQLADPVTLKTALEHANVLDDVGGTAYLAQLLSSMVGIINASEYGRAIHDSWLRRQLVDIGEAIVNNAFGADPGLDALAQINAAEQALSVLGSGGRSLSRMVSAGAAMEAAIEAADRAHHSGVPVGLFFGLHTIDQALDGLDAGTLTLLAGLPGSGKTALIAQMGMALGISRLAAAMLAGMSTQEAQRQPGMLLIELEMSPEEIGQRLAAEQAQIGLTDLRKGKLDMVSSASLVQALAQSRYVPFRIHDMAGVPIGLLPAKIMMHLRRQPELVVAIDNILVRGAEEESGRNASRGLDASSVAKLTGQLKSVARRTGVPIIALTHISRPARDGPVRRPVQSDVKWAGEGDADNVVFVHRPEMLMDSTVPAQTVKESDHIYSLRVNRWHQDRDAVKNLAEIVVAKRRQGPTGVWRMRWHGPTTSLREWEAQPTAAATTPHGPVTDQIPTEAYFGDQL